MKSIDAGHYKYLFRINSLDLINTKQHAICIVSWITKVTYTYIREILLKATSTSNGVSKKHNISVKMQLFNSISPSTYTPIIPTLGRVQLYQSNSFQFAINVIRFYASYKEYNSK